MRRKSTYTSTLEIGVKAKMKIKHKNIMKGRNALIGALFALGLSPLAHADQTFTVTTVEDERDANLSDLSCNTLSNVCSLRAAIEQANAIDDGITTINIPVANNYLLTIGGTGENAAASGDLDITSQIVITGAGSDQVAIDGGKIDRVFDVHPNASLTLNDLTVRNGNNQVPAANPNLITQTDIRANDGGGGIKAVSATLVLNGVNVSDNNAGGVGGGIDIRGGSAIINASTIDNNFVAGFGGGISNMLGQLEINDSTIANNNNFVQDIIFGGGIFNSGDVNSLVINRSTIANNSAYRDGGGIYHQIGGLAMTNSTISGNQAGRWGGGLYNASTSSFYVTSLLHVTVTDNDALGNISENTPVSEPTDPKGGGLYNRAQSGRNGGATLGLYNSLIAGNGNGGDCFNDVSNPQSPAFLIKAGTATGDNTCVNAGEVISSTPSTMIDLQPLSNNGGATQTHALTGNSSAVINQGLGQYCPNHDQRKFGPRGIVSCDSGAFEFGATDFGLPLVTPPIAYVPPPVGSGNNQPPQAFDLLTVAQPGEVIAAQVTAIDLDVADTLRYFDQDPPAHKGTVLSWNLDGTFTYQANTGASGVDTFGFGVCDGSLACDGGLVSVVINNSSVESRVVATVEAGTGDPSPVTVISESDLFATISDPDFTYPLGAMFFDVDKVVPDAGKNTITVSLQLPTAVTIDANAVVRKMNKFGIWSTLRTTLDPNELESSGVFDAVNKRVTLTLVDNGIFDLNSAPGFISDPVALGVSTKPVAASTNSPGTTSAAVADEGGGGIASLGGLSGLLLLSLWRRRRQLNLH